MNSFARSYVYRRRNEHSQFPGYPSSDPVNNTFRSQSTASKLLFRCWKSIPINIPDDTYGTRNSVQTVDTAIP